MSRSETAALRCTGNAARESSPTPATVDENEAPGKSTALLLQAAAALPVGFGGFCCLPSGEWFDVWRESAELARAWRITEAEVRNGLLAEARFLEAEPLGGVA